VRETNAWWVDHLRDRADAASGRIEAPLGYRADIDGLRAFAVAAVAAFYLLPFNDTAYGSHG
jgi:peptidoglycan/LPS O-acetylase OafA/YrhL